MRSLLLAFTLVAALAGPAVAQQETPGANPPAGPPGETDLDRELDRPLPPAGVVAGQWVYTSQYGWIWIPSPGALGTYGPTYGPPGAYVFGGPLGWPGGPWMGWGFPPYGGSFGFYGGFAWHSHPSAHFHGGAPPHHHGGSPGGGHGGGRGH